MTSDASSLPYLSNLRLGFSFSHLTGEVRRLDDRKVGLEEASTSALPFPWLRRRRSPSPAVAWDEKTPANNLLQWRRRWVRGQKWHESADFRLFSDNLPFCPSLHFNEPAAPKEKMVIFHLIFFLIFFLKIVQSYWCPGFLAQDFWSPWRLHSGLKIFLTRRSNFFLLAQNFYFVPKQHKKLILRVRNFVL